MIMNYPKCIAEIVTLINSATAILLDAKPGERRIQQAENLLQDAATKAATGVKDLSDGGVSLRPRLRVSMHWRSGVSRSRLPDGYRTCSEMV